MEFMSDLTDTLSNIPSRQYNHALDIFKQHARVVFIGNGGSAAIASHLANDFTKNGGKKAIAFNDAAALLGTANDYGFDQVFAQQLKFHARQGDVLVAISSSGNSPDIIEAAKYAKEVGLTVITMSGFSETNKLRELGVLNIWIDSMDYGIVEIAHLAFMHSLIHRL